MLLGEKIVRKIDLHEGVRATRKEDIKDEIVLEGTNLENVSLSSIYDMTRIKSLRCFGSPICFGQEQRYP